MQRWAGYANMPDTPWWICNGTGLVPESSKLLNDEDGSSQCENKHVNQARNGLQTHSINHALDGV
jgi:hypothetical protein